VVVPESTRAATNLIVETSGKHTPKIQKNMFVPEIEHDQLKRIFYAKELEGDVMKQVLVGEFKDSELSQLITAKEAIWQREKDQWLFKDGIIYPLSDTGEYKHLIRFAEQYITIKYTPADFFMGDKKPDEMNVRELANYVKLKKKMGEDVTDYEIQLNMKMSIPFACLVFCLLGAPLGLTPKRASSSIGLGISIIIIILYYIMMSISVAFGELRLLTPGFSAWLPNILTAGIGWHFLNRSANG
jgi:lipopolysaccharide export system permease protein